MQISKFMHLVSYLLQIDALSQLGELLPTNFDQQKAKAAENITW